MRSIMELRYPSAQEHTMPSDPSAEPTAQSLDPAQTVAGTQPARPAKDDLPDADAAEPVPHEHLPTRSDDN
ncbi:hypothetical protein AN416_29040 (plasmid) [Paraburkholderia caribensis]|nr:hypothetical protein AN416_29040 [Paraburkholderia caribensis]AUT56496.1 hypothetical protein C2L66_31925 [Paraburkholderia caribensis]